MDCVKIGNLIAKLRKEKKLTQRNIADALGIQNKTVSKWECGLGCPDLSLWPELSTILGVDMKQMMEGEITSNKPDSGNIHKVLPLSALLLFQIFLLHNYLLRFDILFLLIRLLFVPLFLSFDIFQIIAIPVLFFK